MQSKDPLLLGLFTLRPSSATAVQLIYCFHIFHKSTPVVPPTYKYSMLRSCSQDNSIKAVTQQCSSTRILPFGRGESSTTACKFVELRCFVL